MNSQFIHNQSQNIEILLDHILKIPGDKIVTLAIGNQPFAEDETAIETAIREIKEETGLIPLKLYSADAVETFYLHSLNKIIFVPVFVAFVKETNVQLCANEHDAYEWLPFEEARLRLVWAEQRRIIEHVHELFVMKQPNNLLLIDVLFQ